MIFFRAVFLALALSLVLPSCSRDRDTKDTNAPASNQQSIQSPITGLRYLTIVSTNDIHGGIEPRKTSKGITGGMAILSGTFKAIRDGLKNKYGRNAGVIAVDAGDQFSGTLISNYNEGFLVYQIMSQMGYDAVVPGNHLYDFGPKGWLEDKVSERTQDKNPRGVVESLSQQANFPLISANTFFKNSIFSKEGKQLEVSGVGCKTKDGSLIDWSRARTPSFLRPFVINEVAGLRVAIIGIDFISTSTTTTPENVADLCFSDETESYKRIRTSLEGQADVFILVAHDGDSRDGNSASKMTGELLTWNPRAVDLVIAGHTHFIHNENINGVRVMQSGADGQNYGRVDLVWDPESRAIDVSKTQSAAGIPLLHEDCKSGLPTNYCEKDGSKILVEGIVREEDILVKEMIARERREVDRIAKRKLGVAEKRLWRDRIGESPLGNALTDAFRAASGADLAFINTGGIRRDLDAGEITYEDLFYVLPFANRGLVVGPMSWDKLKALLLRAARTCSLYGTLAQSGLRVAYERDCNEPQNKQSGLDPNAKLIQVKTVDGEILFDSEAGQEVTPARQFKVATLDFLAAGGSGYSEFKDVPALLDMGVVREVLADTLAKSPAQWSGATDGRWVQKSR